MTSTNTEEMQHCISNTHYKVQNLMLIDKVFCISGYFFSPILVDEICIRCAAGNKSSLVKFLYHFGYWL